MGSSPIEPLGGLMGLFFRAHPWHGVAIGEDTPTVVTVYVGSLNAAMVRVGEVFKAALAWNSAALIVVHNHPSGDPTPSTEDVLITQQIVAAGKLLDVDVLDHLVIGQGRYTSMREKGLGFAR